MNEMVYLIKKALLYNAEHLILTLNMTTFTAVIIDDEESARNILKELLARFCQNVEVMGAYRNLEEGVKGIKQHKPDAVFLDIQMPQYAGYEIVSFFPQINFELVFVTAYDNYAIKAFDLSAVDYLLKPIEIDKLKTAVQRLSDRVATKHLKSDYKALVENLREDTVQNIAFPHGGQQKIVLLTDILALEAQESYTRLYTLTGEQYTISKNLKQFENMLSDISFFLRTHKSWIVNMKYVGSFSRRNQTIALSNDVTARVSKLRQKTFQERLKSI